MTYDAAYEAGVAGADEMVIGLGDLRAGDITRAPAMTEDRFEGGEAVVGQVGPGSARFVQEVAVVYLLG